MSPNETPTAAKMRSDLERIKKMIDEYEQADEAPTTTSLIKSLQSREAIFRELLTSWQAATVADYYTEIRLYLNMLTKRMLNE